MSRSVEAMLLFIISIILISYGINAFLSWYTNLSSVRKYNEIVSFFEHLSVIIENGKGAIIAKAPITIYENSEYFTKLKFEVKRIGETETSTYIQDIFLSKIEFDQYGYRAEGEGFIFGDNLPFATIEESFISIRQIAENGRLRLVLLPKIKLSYEKSEFHGLQAYYIKIIVTKFCLEQYEEESILVVPDDRIIIAHNFTEVLSPPMMFFGKSLFLEISLFKDNEIISEPYTLSLELEEDGVFIIYYIVDNYLFSV